MADRFDLKKKADASPARARPKSRGRGAGGASRKKTPPPAPKPTTYSREEQTKLLATYVPVPKAFWVELPQGAHIRYYIRGPDGNPLFRVGGWIRRSPYVWKPRDSPVEKRGLLLGGNFSPPRGRKDLTWPVEFADVTHVYVRADPSALLVRKELGQIVQDINARIATLTSHNRSLSERIVALESRMASHGGRGRDAATHHRAASRHRSHSRHSRD